MSLSRRAMTLMFAPVSLQIPPSQNKTTQLTTNRRLRQRVFPPLHHGGLSSCYEGNPTRPAPPLQPRANPHPQAPATSVNRALHE